MISTNELIEFTNNFYKDRDLMHNLSHISRILKMVDKLKNYVNEPVNDDYLIYGAYFHGCIKNHETEIINWLYAQNVDKVEEILLISKESLKENTAKTIEGRLLHDAHMIEGGKFFLLMKSMITGSLRGQGLNETIAYFENNVLHYGKCYLHEAEEILSEARKEALRILSDIKKNI